MARLTDDDVDDLLYQFEEENSEKMFALLCEVRLCRRLEKFAGELESVVMRLVDKWIPSYGSGLMTRESLDKVFTELDALLTTLKQEPPPEQATHILWGDQIICDKRSWQMWRRVDGQSYIEIKALVADGERLGSSKTNLAALAEYANSAPCAGCLRRFPEIMAGVNELMANYAKGWSEAALGPLEKPSDE